MFRNEMSNQETKRGKSCKLSWPRTLIKRYYQVTANAIKAILATAKRLEKKLARVEVKSISNSKNYIKKV